MAFKARFSRREDGGYDCAYGKGSKKIEAILMLEGGKWFVRFGFMVDKIEPTKKLGEMKAAWGTAAEAAYGGSPEEVDAPTAPMPKPPPPSLRPPPSLKAPPIPCPKLNAGHGMFDDTFGEGFGEQFVIPDLAPAGVATCPHCGQPPTGWTFTKPAVGEGHGRYLPPCRCNFGEHGPVEEYQPDPFDPRFWKRNPESGKFDVMTVIGSMDMAYYWMLHNREYVMTDGKLTEPWASIQRTLFETTSYPEYRPERWENQ